MMEGSSAKRRLVGHKMLKFVVALLFLTSLCSHAGAATNPTDVTALNALRDAWGAGNLKWPTSGDPCTDKWPGVLCDQEPSPRVTSLILSSMGISGTLPAIIGSLLGLVTLELSFNPSLGGALPIELGQLTALQSLSLQSGSFTGSIPTTLGNLKSLTFLALNGNKLSGPIPSSLGALANLYWLDLSSNNLTGGLPVSTTSIDGHGLDRLQNCMHFHLNNNSLSGSIPSELGGGPGGVLPRLAIHMLLDSNQFTGTIPESFGNLTALQILNVGNNQLVGPIPTSINKIVQPASSVPSLQQLVVANNQLNGTIPDFSALTGLLMVDFSNNTFDVQPFPAWFNRTTLLQTIFVQQAQLTGTFPSNLLSSPYLEALWASNNTLDGILTLPSVIGQNLGLISLQNNNLIALVQDNPAFNTSSIQLELEGNPVCSPTSRSQPAGACSIPVSSFQPWQSPLPQPSNCASQCSGDLVLNYQNPSNCNCSKPLNVQLQIRQPSFSIITDGLMQNLHDQLYPQLGLLSTQVWIYDASFTSNGRVDVTVYFFSADEKQPLSQSIITNITSSLGGQKVTLNGFMPYVVTIVLGISALSAQRGGIGAGAISGIVVGAAVIVAIVAVYAYLQKRRADKLKSITQPFATWGGGGGDNGEAPQLKGAKGFSFSDLKKATNNFSDSNEIGAGGYGKVYKGVLPSGELVAVKRAQEGSMQGAQEFKNEIELLSRVHHKNLVGLVGFCYEQGEQMLVYEFMVNGTMREWLLGKMAYPLDWSKRLSIAVGSARGLAYLHELANPPIIHRDIKSSNILLDENHVAKVADFGLSKLAPDGADKLLQTTQVKGTLGYLDPEYYMTQQLSEKSDVYSFGVVLLELLTSRAPIEHGKYIVREVRTALDKGGMATLRPLLDPSVQEVPAQNLERFLDLALVCVEEKGVDRPTMNEVVKELEDLARLDQPAKGAPPSFTEKHWPDAVVDTGDDIMEKGDSTFQYSGGYQPRNPEPK